jgi:hypothetical protein
MATKILVIALASDLDIAGELSSVLGPGYEVTLLRGADRQKLDMALDGRTQYGIVHILAHGGVSKLDAADGLVSEAELVTLIESQSCLQFVVVAACDSYELVGGIHNALHVPCIGYNAPIDDRAAVEFSRAFYRAWRRSGDVDLAVERGRESLAVLYPSEAPKVRLINGDMVTPTKFSACMAEVRETLAGVEGRLGRIEERLARNEEIPRRWAVVAVVLAVALLIAQVGTPFLNAALIHLTP